MPIKGDEKWYLQNSKCERIAYSVSDEAMKRQAKMVEGPEAWKRFEGTMRGVLSVPHSKIQRRIEEHRKEAASTPKRKSKPPASPDV
jgi:hypothetical protein